ncbi:MAG TPA: metallophosphoesterase [Longimicrobiaceae bacterium]|nr:metallophosphoesterase [Longimicrobiaceae bacterium]
MRRTIYRFFGILLFWGVVATGCAPQTFEIITSDPIPPEAIAVDVFLIGDAGLPAPTGEPVLIALEEAIAWDTLRPIVVFLGDNVYPRGLPEPGALDRAEGERILKAQIDVLLSTGVEGIFVPGNHDWDAGSPNGWQAVLREQEFVEDYGGDNVTYLPGGGCPGPKVVDVAESVRIIALDTQWWLHDGPKPRGPVSECQFDTEEEVVDGIKTALEAAGNRVTIVVAHHPMVSGGEHGGYFDWPAYLFPPYLLARRLGWFAPQDVGSVQYMNMIRHFQDAFRENPPTLFAGGHEHNLQILAGNVVKYHLVSGAGIYGHLTPVRVIPATYYAREESGFMRLSVRKDGWARLAVMVVDGTGEAREDYSIWLEPKSSSNNPSTEQK